MFNLHILALSVASEGYTETRRTYEIWCLLFILDILF
jgi:hypothetical protein